MASTLPGPAAQASKAALQAALAENEKKNSENVDEEGEAQELEVNMESQAENIRTVFSDPTNFNVKHPLFSQWTLRFD
jgi:translation initiation factor 4E